MHGRAAVLLTAVLLVGGTALPARAAVPDGDQRRQVSVTFTGSGYGHGKGLSQYGARNRANDGQGYREIVKAYYPGTHWGTAGGSVRVLLTGDTTTDVQVVPRSKLAVRSLGAHKTWTLPAKRDGKSVTRWKITPASKHRSVVSYRTRAWHAWRTAKGDAEFAAGGRPIALRTPNGLVSYRGTLRSASVDSSGTARNTVNILPFDSYLRGVVPKEVPGTWPAAAVRAQAVAARTYAAYERAAVPASRYYDLCDTAHCQVYGGQSAEFSKSSDAVAATAKRIVTYAGEPAFAQFSASNGGYSAAGGFPYLRAEPDPYDHGYPGDPWTATFTGDQITRNWSDLGQLQSIAIDQWEVDDQRAHVLRVKVTDTDGVSHRVSGATLASWLGLRSTRFEITQE
jgi:stage II sporulation protein D